MDSWQYEDEWFEETNVSTKIRDYLASAGYQILKFNEDKTKKGHDIEAKKDGVMMVVEVKGYPSDKYVRGDNKGQKKPTHPKLQVKHWFSEALLTLLFAKCNDWDTNISFGLPDLPKYRELIEKMAPMMKYAKIECFFVKENGDVEWISHDGEAATH